MSNHQNGDGDVVSILLVLVAYIVDRLRSRIAASNSNSNSWKLDLLRFQCRRCLHQVLRKSGGVCCSCSNSLMKLIPEDQLLIAPGLDKEKITAVTISIGDGGV